jgi:hypothetical protein
VHTEFWSEHLKGGENFGDVINGSRIIQDWKGVLSGVY